jgi:hypothetical protein
VSSWLASKPVDANPESCLPANQNALDTASPGRVNSGWQGGRRRRWQPAQMVVSVDDTPLVCGEAGGMHKMLGRLVLWIAEMLDRSLITVPDIEFDERSSGAVIASPYSPKRLW